MVELSLTNEIKSLSRVYLMSEISTTNRVVVSAKTPNGGPEYHPNEGYKQRKSSMKIASLRRHPERHWQKASHKASDETKLIIQKACIIIILLSLPLPLGRVVSDHIICCLRVCLFLVSDFKFAWCYHISHIVVKRAMFSKWCNLFFPQKRVDSQREWHDEYTRGSWAGSWQLGF